MKITKTGKNMHVKPRWMFLKVYTDEGIMGTANRSLKAGRVPSKQP